MPGKPTLAHLVQHHHITLNTLDVACSVPTSSIWRMYHNYPLPYENALEVLRSLNIACGTAYTLNDISVRLQEVK